MTPNLRENLDKLKAGLRYAGWLSLPQIADRLKVPGSQYPLLAAIVREAVDEGVIRYGTVGSKGVVVPVFQFAGGKGSEHGARSNHDRLCRLPHVDAQPA